MKDNREVLNEAFFKKATYADKKAKRMPQYNPIDSTQGVMQGSSAFAVTDTQEVKKRLAGTFGATFGSNNVKNMASRSVKTFPIIISDNIEPETAVMLKKLLEEQYAEYINLLVSNQVVNLADFNTGDEDGNIAIQALDKISDNDFSNSRIANTAARKGSLTTDDVFSNVPLYNLLRENQQVLTSGDTIIDTLLENALVVSNDVEAKQVISFIQENADEIARIIEESALEEERVPRAMERQSGEKPDEVVFDDSGLPIRNTYKAGRGSVSGSSYNKNVGKEKEDLSKYLMDISKEDPHAGEKIGKRELNIDLIRGYGGTDEKGNEIFTKLTTADIVIDRDQMDKAVNRTVGYFLTQKENYNIRDKFEKAVMLLQSRRIAGVEFYQYCVLRLGIPVSDKARLELVKQFKISQVRGEGMILRDVKTDGNNSEFMTRNTRDGSKHSKTEVAIPLIGASEVEAIANNKRATLGIVREITKVKIKDVLKAAGIGAATGLGLGGAVGIAGVSLGAFVSVVPPIALGAVAGALIGTAAYAIAKYLKNKRDKKYNAEISKLGIEGWERVEFLINKMEQQQSEVRRNASKIENNGARPVSYDTLVSSKAPRQQTAEEMVANARKSLENAQDFTANAITQVKKELEPVLKEAVEYPTENTLLTFNETFKLSIPENAQLIQESYAECLEEPDFAAEVLVEKTLAKTSTPVEIKYVEKRPDKAALITPSSMARATYAYGSTEIERKENKDRRYNQPLIMTVKFKERFSDGKYSDNELTAVIGILGKIIRVPSEEMQYILAQAAEGNTIEGIFKDKDIDLKNAVSELLGSSKISKEVKALPQSADVWHNLERISTLAAANKISGRRNSNISNAHIIFSQKEVDGVRTDTGVDFLKEVKKAVALMKRYSAFTLMVANDAGQRVYILDDQDNISWNVVPYSALAGKDSGEQLNAALTKMMRL